MNPVSCARRFDGRVVVVSGAGGGIGRATAQRLASEGAAVACLDVRVDKNDETASQIIATGGSALAIACDLTDPEAVPDAVERVISSFDRIDAVCNIAAYGHFVRDEDESLEGWNRILAVNLTGTFLLCVACLPHLIRARGSIVNTASIGGINAQPWCSAYSASKGGVIALSRTLAVTHASAGLRVNVIAPGSVDTETARSLSMPPEFDKALHQRMMPFLRSGMPDELAGAYAYLASDDASFVNGAVLVVDGGKSA
jgi:NAD(P)-dependent dehydrogenase (short-subunit alcohol dehydrogenase family)